MNNLLYLKTNHKNIKWQPKENIYNKKENSKKAKPIVEPEIETVQR